VPIKFLWGIMDQMYGRLLMNTNSPSWSYGSPVVLEFSYCIYDDRDKPFVSNCTFKICILPPYFNNSLLLTEKASAPIQFNARVRVVATACWID